MVITMFQKMNYVYMVYREQSFTKAAEKLFISQPCLSMAIKKIETELGVPLFERHFSTVTPTPAGLDYIQTAEKIMDLEKEFCSRISDRNNLEYGHLSIGGSNYVSAYLLPRIISRFSQLHPKIQITLSETSSVELEKKILNEEIDLMIDSFGEEKEGFSYTPLLTEKILLAVHKSCTSNKNLEEYRLTPSRFYNQNLPVTAIKELPITRFEKEKFILLKKGNDMYQHAMRIFQKANITPAVSFYLDQLSTSCTLAASNQGICFATDTLFRYQNYADDFYLYNIKNSGTRTLYLAQKKNRYTTKAMSRFMEIAKELL